jgi:glutamate/tyrosine decarboxylase-like PLP-dependent enzyme
VNFSDLGVQLSRTSRALKLWLSLRYFGIDAFRAAIDRCIDLARLAQARIEASTQLELLTPAKLGVVCFRRRLDGADEDRLEQLNRSLAEGLAASGQGLVSSTRLPGPLCAADVCAQPHQRHPGRGAGARLVRARAPASGGGRAADLAAHLRP